MTSRIITAGQQTPKEHNSSLLLMALAYKAIGGPQPLCSRCYCLFCLFCVSDVLIN